MKMKMVLTARTDAAAAVAGNRIELLSEARVWAEDDDEELSFIVV
jgi:hypothetical protein